MLLCVEVSRDRSIRLGVAFEILGILCSCALKYPKILASVMEKFIPLSRACRCAKTLLIEKTILQKILSFFAFNNRLFFLAEKSKADFTRWDSK